MSECVNYAELHTLAWMCVPIAVHRSLEGKNDGGKRRAPQMLEAVGRLDMREGAEEANGGVNKGGGVSGGGSEGR
eukprot:1782564-Pleurochrysis_carterae.AAC.1